MARYIAFLRAINVGGRTVPMQRLRDLFADMGFRRVESFIASGNIVFETSRARRAALEARIAAQLEKAVGYAVPAFVRSDAELADVAAYPAFPPRELQAAAALNVAFVAVAPDAAARARLATRKSRADDFHVHGREVYWLCRRRQSESKFSNAALEKVLGQPSTMRSISTLRRMSARWPPDPARP